MGKGGGGGVPPLLPHEKYNLRQYFGHKAKPLLTTLVPSRWLKIDLVFFFA